MITKPWSEDEQRHLVLLVNQGLSALVIATRLGRSKNSVIGRCHRLGITLAMPKGGQAASRPKAFYKPKPRAEIRSTIGLHTIKRDIPKKRKSGWQDGLTDTSHHLPPTTTLAVIPAGRCHWVDTVSADSAMCGRPVQSGAWCTYHRSLVYKPNSTGKVKK